VTLSVQDATIRVVSERNSDRSVLLRPSRPLISLVLTVAAIAAALAATSTGAIGVSPQTTTTSNTVKSIERFAVSQFAVFARPQEAKDRSLPAVARRAVRLGGLGPGFHDVLNGVIPSLTRFTQTLPDGREVFLTVYNPATRLPRRARRHLPPHTILIVGPVIVQPDGRWTNGQPLDTSSGGDTARDAYIIARTGHQACSLDTYSVIVPNQVARIRWRFGRQDPLGYVFKAPLTVNLTPRGNVAVTTIPQRTSCDRPAAVTLYERDGQVLSHTGNTSNLNRITRPINHGNPFAYKSLLHRPASATGKH
jgi:hypothetical protein